ncbi:uncharacterized protein [Antennarius striatus]|uniref:uncharacterized protein isoform X2 n=1 Tax=Antennarius striatus TaxID=241820 RepID=UPI0035AE6B54
MPRKYSRNYFKTLFSKSEASQSEPVEKDANKTGGEKKSFKFPKFNKKTKNDSEKPEIQPSAVEPSGDDREPWIENIKSKRSLYSTSSKSRGKEFSYSELDLRKAKKFATFSFGFKKKRMKDEDGMSKSTVGLHLQGTEEKTSLEPSQMELNQAKTKRMLSLSQPELDSSEKFDIPSPPPVVINRSESSFPLLNKLVSAVTTNTQSEPRDPLKNEPDLTDVPKETKALIATIPDLTDVPKDTRALIVTIPEPQIEKPVLIEETKNIPVHDSSISIRDNSTASTMTHTKTTSDAGYQSIAVLPSSLPQVMFDSLDHKADIAESVSSGNSRRDNVNEEQLYTIKENSVTESTVTLSHHHSDAPDTTESTAPNSKPFLASQDSNSDTTTTELAPVIHSDSVTLSADSVFVPQDIPISPSERSSPKIAKSVALTPAVINEKSLSPVEKDVVYGALYDSLLPQKFGTEVMSTLSNPPPQTLTGMRCLNTKLETVVVKTLDESNTQPNVVYSLSTSSGSAAGRPDDTVGRYKNQIFSENSHPYSTRFTSVQTASVSESERNPDINHRFGSSSVYSGSHSVDDSELTHSLSQAKSGNSSLIRETFRSASVTQNYVPPTYDYATSQRTHTQVTDSIEGEILVKESVTNEVSSDTCCTTALPKENIPAKSIEINMETTDPAQQVDGRDEYQSPTYLSQGSDDGSVLEIYYSAEEDNAEIVDEERYPVNKREEISMANRVKEAIGLLQEFPDRGETVERQTVKRDHRELKGTVVKIQNEDGIMGEEKEDGNTLTEVQRQRSTEGQLQETGMFLAANDVKSQPKEDVPSAVLSHVKEQGLYTRKEELLATQVQQPNIPLVCDLAPPSIEWIGKNNSSEQPWEKELETEDHSNGTKELPTQRAEYLTNKYRSYEYVHPTAPKDFITPKYIEAELQMIHNTESDKRGEVSKEKTQASSILTSAVTDISGGAKVVTSTSLRSSEVQSNATEIEHNRPLQTTEWVDTITTKTVPQQVAVELSIQNADLPCTETAGTHSEKTEYLTLLHQNQGSLTSLPSETSEVLGSGNHLSKTDQTSVDDMKSVYEKHASLANMLNDRPSVYLRYEGEPAEQQGDEWKRSSARQEEPIVAAGERERQNGRESEAEKSCWNSQRHPLSDLSSAQRTSSVTINSFQEDNDPSIFTGVFQATLVELVPDPTAPLYTPPSSPDADSPNQLDMDILVDTLKNMEPTLRSRNTSIRAPAPGLVSSLPPIVEDSSSPVVSDVPDSATLPTKMMEATTRTTDSNGLYTLPVELGLKKNIFKEGRSTLEMIRMNNQEQPGTKDWTSPLRTSLTNNFMMRKPFDSHEDPQVSNGNVGISSSPSSRIENSVIFGRTASNQTMENRQAHRPLFRTSSLPDTGLSKDRMSVGLKEAEMGMADPTLSRFDRFSFLLNPSSSVPGSITGADDHGIHVSRPPLGLGSPPLNNSPTRLLSPTGSIELQRPFMTDSHLSKISHTPVVGMGMGTGRVGAPILQRNQTEETPVAVQQNLRFNIDHGGHQLQPQEVDRNLLLKYRAFPDAYLTKEKEHGKLNPRPGKMYIFDRPGMCGDRLEVRGDVSDGTSWNLQETISIRVIRGGWVLYEKPNFKGEKIALDEGDIELTYPFNPPEEQQKNGHTEGKEVKAETGDAQTDANPPRRFIIGSLRRAVRDYSVPEISLFPEQNAEGKKVTFRDTSEDARIFGFPIKANSIIINAGLWLVYAHPFFQGVPRVLEVGGYSNPEAWGVEQPYVGSVHPLKIGEPRVENMSEPKIVIYHKPYFTGKSRTLTSSMRDFITRMDQEQTAFMYNAGSIKVLSGIWVGYEKEGYRGRQYLLEEGEYHDWRVWGGCDSELRSVRVIRADLTDPIMVMFEQEEEGENAEQNSFEVTEAIPDVELFEYKINTCSIHVLSGAWIAYSHVDFSGNQYILEKGFYNNCADWGSQDNRICSVQPILRAQTGSSSVINQVTLYSEPDFKGVCQVIESNKEEVSDKKPTKSCKVSGGSWVIYENIEFSGNTYVLSEGDYPNLSSMGCPPGFILRSLKAVPMTFSVPSISLFGLECLEGREITTEGEIFNLVEEGFNNHVLSVRVNSGSWVICEHSNYRGRQFLLEPIEITNWVKFSSLHTIGSMYPVRQKRCFFRIKNKESGHVMSVQGGVEEMKSGRVVVTPEVEPMSDIWFYQDGFIKNKLSQNMSLQVMGNVEPGAKVVLWTETRQPIQTWTAQMKGLITSLTFCGMVLDVKGGKTYDKDHLIILPEDEERPSQQWEIQLL